MLVFYTASQDIVILFQDFPLLLQALYMLSRFSFTFKDPFIVRFESKFFPKQSRYLPNSGCDIRNHFCGVLNILCYFLNSLCYLLKMFVIYRNPIVLPRLTCSLYRSENLTCYLSDVINLLSGLLSCNTRPSRKNISVFSSWIYTPVIFRAWTNTLYKNFHL